VAAHLRRLKANFGDESVREAYSGVPRQCICRMAPVEEVINCTGDGIHHTHIDNRKFLFFLYCIVVDVDD